MYADDPVIYVSAKNPGDGSGGTLKRNVYRVKHNHPTLSYSKTASMCFSLKRKVDGNFRVRSVGREVEEIYEFEFFGVTLDSQLQFDGHIKRLCKSFKTNLICLRLLRSYIPLKGAQQFMHRIIFSHSSYRITAWGQAK